MSKKVLKSVVYVVFNIGAKEIKLIRELERKAHDNEKKMMEAGED